MIKEFNNEKLKEFNERKPYKVQVTIIEALDIKSVNKNGLSNIFVQISCANEPKQSTTTIYQTTSGSWNQSFTFPNLLLNDHEFEKFELKFEVIDKNDFSANNMLGSYSIGLSTLYKNLNHEYFNQLLYLTNPTNFKNKLRGYLKVSCYIIGKNDKPPVHTPDEFLDQNDFEDIEIEDKNNTGLKILGQPNMIQKSYQLNINIIRGEDLPVMGYYKLDSFISAKVNNNLLKTAVISNTQKPKFSCRLQFPIDFPLLNDKIILQLWDNSSFINGGDTFIANIPENPFINSWFNLNFLQSCGGNISFRWINLYGIPVIERKGNINKIITGKVNYNEGTYYMGRILLSLNLIPHDKPEIGNTYFSGFNEPNQISFILRVEIYELLLKKKYQIAWVNIKFGGAKEENSEKENPKQNKKSKSNYTRFQWKDYDTLIKEIKFNLPLDYKQIPDIFINIYTENLLKKEQRISYVRIPAVHNDLKNDKLNWYKLKDNWNNNNPSTGSILANLQLIDTNKVKKLSVRNPKKRRTKNDYQMIIFLYSAFELEPEIESNKVNPKIEIYFEGQLFEFENTNEPTKNPIFEKYLHKKITLYDDLEIANDIEITVKNKISNKFNIFKNNTIGSCYISPKNLKMIKIIDDLNIEPELYNIYEDNKLKGKLLLQINFIKNQNKINLDNLFNIKKKIYRLYISCIGLRNLSYDLKNWTIVYKIPSLKFIRKLKKENNGIINDNSLFYKNFNICECIKALDLKLPINKLFWPKLEIEIYEGNSLYYITSIFLFEYSGESKNKINDLKIKLGLEEEDVNEFKNSKKNNNKTNNLREKIVKGSVLCNNLTHINKKMTVQKKTFVNKISKTYTPNKKITLNYENNLLEGIEEEEEKENLNVIEEYKPNLKKNIKKKDESFNDGIEDDNEEDYINNFKINNVYYTEIDPLNVMEYSNRNDIENCIFSGYDIFCSNEEKLHEKEIRKNEIEIKKKEIEKLKTIPNYDENEKLKLIKEANRIKSEFITQKKFLKNLKNNEIEKINYGREFIKGSYNDTIKLLYEKIPLFIYSKIGSNNFLYNKYNFSGQKTESLFLGGFKIVEEKIYKESKVNNEEIKYENDTCFNLYKNCLLQLFNKIKIVRIRFYLLRGLNLTAQGDVTNIKEYLAGQRAYSIANPYPEFYVGDGENNNGLIKTIKEPHNYEENTLNPEFNKLYELSAIFPFDSKLEVLIKHHGSFLIHPVIGSISIDLEERLFSDLNLIEKKSLTILKKYYEDKRKNKQENRLKYNKKIKFLDEKLKNFNPNKSLNPVEYNNLVNSEKGLVQGTVEMILDVFTEEDIPKIKIEKSKPQFFEIRLIIWEVIDLKLDKKESADIFVKGSVEIDGWTADKIIQCTDNHLNSDGNAQYNWRMLFPFKIPCSFPRLKLNVLEFSALSSDESLGEVTIKFDNIIKKLKNDGKYECPPKRFPLSNLKNLKDQKTSDEKIGEISISFAIIPSSEAESNPVGKGRDNPNQNPYLEIPKNGRGISDFVSNKLNFKFFNFFKFLKYKKYIAIIFSLILLFILFIRPGLIVRIF